MITPDNDAERGVEVPTQRGRKRWKIGGTLRAFSPVPKIGPPRLEGRPAAAKEPKGPYLTMPELVVDRRPRCPRAPITARHAVSSTCTFDSTRS